MGCEKAENFFSIAQSPATKESVATRLLAMDILASYCMRDRFDCGLKGNRFSTYVPSQTREKAQEILKTLADDPLKDIRNKAEQLLGISVPNPQGTRKYINSRSNE